MTYLQTLFDKKQGGFVTFFMLISVKGQCKKHNNNLMTDDNTGESELAAVPKLDLISFSF